MWNAKNLDLGGKKKMLGPTWVYLENITCERLWFYLYGQEDEIGEMMHQHQDGNQLMFQE